VVKAAGCGSAIRRFKSGHSPYKRTIYWKITKNIIMSRYRGPKLRITRRLGILPGLIQKQSKKKDKPGQHGKTNAEGNKKISEYGLRLQEKQKLKYNYGLSESQLYLYIKEARRRKGVTGLILLQLLEMRLDVICFSLGFAPTIASARQLISHRHITVNGKIVDIASFQCRVNDLISIKNSQVTKTIIDNNLKNIRFSDKPTHLKFDSEKLEAKIVNYCDRKDILLELNELLVIEYYSRR
jgi:small subunit ribosomal protein S4